MATTTCYAQQTFVWIASSSLVPFRCPGCNMEIRYGDEHVTAGVEATWRRHARE